MEKQSWLGVGWLGWLRYGIKRAGSDVMMQDLLGTSPTSKAAACH
jgi:hypothetical protein